MSAVDYLVLISTMVGIALYGVWRTRGKRDLKSYVKGSGNTAWWVIGISVMATQASATTFLSTPGQGYNSGLSFIQNYFGAPFALIIISIFFLPIFRKLNVYTAYEYLGSRFDVKTRLLGTFLFLVQRGIGAGLTIYTPAIVLSTVFGWPLQVTIIASGLLVIIYTVVGGTEAVNVTQKYQFAVILLGMATAFIILLMKLPADLRMTDTLALAGGFGKLNAVNFSTDVKTRYTFWSGALGGLFLALSYFGTDQSQVQRYISGSSLRESRLGLMFNAVCKIPMQFFILLLGVLLFAFYQFNHVPVFFDAVVWNQQYQKDTSGVLHQIQADFDIAQEEQRQHLNNWLTARRGGDTQAEAVSLKAASQSLQRMNGLRSTAKDALIAADKSAKSSNENDYVFITFILQHMPHGVIGLLVAVFFAATFSSKAGELNALGTCSTVDLYRLAKPAATDLQSVRASRVFTVIWGLVAIAFALFVDIKENLIQATNIVASIFYGVMVGLFVIGFFIRWIRGTAVFWGAIVAQCLIFYLYWKLDIAYLWFNLIGCVACIVIAGLFQLILPANSPRPDPSL